MRKSNVHILAKRVFLRILLFSLFLVLAQSNAQTVIKADKVLLIGDSHAVGLSLIMAKDAQENEIEFDSFAIGSTHTRQWITRGWLQYAVEKYKPAVVIIVLGTNDYGIRWSKECQHEKDILSCVKREFKPRVDNIIKYLKDRGIGSVWILPPNMRINTSIIDEVILNSDTDYIFDSKCIYLPLEKDRVHVTYEGRKIWSKKIWDFLTLN